jgi:ring-1,2-phenylacetyl-CoA epoxidase subunit PaaC
MESNLYKFCLRLADTSFILSYRLGEYVSHAPFLEEDLSITNVGLDLIGQAESLFKYAAEIKGGGITDDDIAYKREESEYLNFHLVEYPNEDFAFITVRQFFMDVYNYYLFTALKNSSDPTIAAVAAKSIKEVNYHLKRSRKWMLRLGDGTEVSHNKIQYAVNELWKYTDELFDMDDVHKSLVE